MMPTYERRFFLGLLTKVNREKEEQMEAMREEAKTSQGKGKRTTRVSGSQLKAKIKSGEIPNK